MTEAISDHELQPSRHPGEVFTDERRDSTLDTVLADGTDTDKVFEKLEQHGFVVLRGGRREAVDELLPSLGTTVDVTDVEVDSDRPGMVTSPDSLDLHTDHGAIDYVALTCHAQTESGGDSILVDGREVLNKLDEETRRALQRVYLTEHRVFPSDPDRRPLLRPDGDGWRIYYSFWLLEESLDEVTEEALNAFRNALEKTNTTRLSLSPGDVLLFDNHRVLHGRTEIRGDSPRHLTRHWIQQDAPDSTPSDESADSLELPDPISEERIAELKKRGVDPDVATIELSMVKMKLREPDEGKGWTVDECERAELEYKRYLTLNLRYEDRAVVPTEKIDTMWHYHILDTRAYHRDCQEVFGEYFHHFPYFGMRGEEDAENLENSFFETVELYEREFGESMLRNSETSTDCWHDCQGRCWNACSN